MKSHPSRQESTLAILARSRKLIAPLVLLLWLGGLGSVAYKARIILRKSAAVGIDSFADWMALSAGHLDKETYSRFEVFLLREADQVQYTLLALVLITIFLFSLNPLLKVASAHFEAAGEEGQ